MTLALHASGLKGEVTRTFARTFNARKSMSLPRVTINTSFRTSINTKTPAPSPNMLEEQTLPEYEQRTYHEVDIRDIYREKYRIIAKLGYGAHSTVWLAKDQKSNSYVSMKICVLETESESPVANEIRILQHLDKCAQAEKDQGSPGMLLNRRASEIFSIPGRLGQHQCIVSKAESASLHALQEAAGSGPALLPLIKPLLHRLLFPLSWLHHSCGVVHTDLSPTNILTEAQDQSLFQQIESELAANPITPAQSNGTTIYPSLRTVRGMTSYPIITDFGKARFCTPNGSTEWCMPDLYRAPEILLGIPWNNSIDIWSLGMIALEFITGEPLFDPIDRKDNTYVLPLALSQYIRILGPPPLELIRRGGRAAEYFDDKGNFLLDSTLPTSPIPLKYLLPTNCPSEREKELFLCFLRKIFVWDPSKRATVEQLVEDEWLLSAFDE